MPEVMATILFTLVWDEEYLNSWKPTPTSESHPGDLGNLWSIQCYSKDEVFSRIDSLNGLDGVDKIVAVVYGDTTWEKYIEETGIDVQIYDCPWCKRAGGKGVLDPVRYYIG